ncbi:MAG: DoxX family protein [Terriglobales bacterium]
MNHKSLAAVLLVRFAIGGVFLSEGIQKFLFPEDLGFGRFAKIGIPVPGFTAPFVGFVEVVCGLLLLLGLFTRLATIPLLADMAVAIWKTKLPILAKSGFWAMAHEARVDYTMVMGCVFLLIVGAGSLSVDQLLRGRRRPHPASNSSGPQAG